MTPHELFKSGKLTEAIEAATAEIKKAPTDIELRGLLCELLCFADDTDRADKQLDVIGQQKPDAMNSVAVWRQLLRAEKARREFFEQGRPPELVTELTESVQQKLRASLAIREGKLAEAKQLLDQSYDSAPIAKGKCDGQLFEGFRDWDDVTSNVLELLSSSGKYFWLPLENIRKISLSPVTQLRDCMWRPAQLEADGCERGQVYLPVLYPGTEKSDDMSLRVARPTDWISGDDMPTRGIGVRMFMVGEDNKHMLEISEIEFEWTKQSSESSSETAAS